MHKSREPVLPHVGRRHHAFCLQERMSQHHAPKLPTSSLPLGSTTTTLDREVSSTLSVWTNEGFGHVPGRPAWQDTHSVAPTSNASSATDSQHRVSCGVRHNAARSANSRRHVTHKISPHGSMLQTSDWQPELRVLSPPA